MANVIYTIPDHLLDLAYQAYYGSPNSDLFTRNQLQRKPIPPLGLDNLALWTSDALQDLNETIAGINREKIGVEGQKLQLLYFSDDEGTLQAINLQDLINSLPAPLSLDGSNIGKETIYGTSIRKNTLTKDQYGLQSIETEAIKDASMTTPKVADGAITNPKIANGAVQLPKMRSSGHSCFIIGDDADYTYKELLVSPNWNIATRIPNETKPSMQPFLNFWNAQTDNTLTGVKLLNLSLDLTKINSGTQSAGILGSGDGTNAIALILCPNNAYSIVSGGGGNPIAFRVLTNVWNNSPQNTALGTMLQDNSVPKTKIQNVGQVAPFCMGYIAANGSAQKSMNLGSITRTGTGYYLVRFNTAANDKNYIVQITADNVQNYAVTGMVVSRTVNGFDVKIVLYAGQAVDANFSFAVYAF